MRGIIVLVAAIVIVLIAVYAVIMPNINSTNIQSNEHRAFLACRSIQEACEMYKKVYGDFPADLLILGTDSHEFLPKEISRGKTPGYKYYYETTPKGFSLRAMPSTMTQTGRYIFYLDETGTLTACNSNNACGTIAQDWLAPTLTQ